MLGIGRKFRQEVSAPDRSRELDVLAHYRAKRFLRWVCDCEDEGRRHRSVLRELSVMSGAAVT